MNREEKSESQLEETPQNSIKNIEINLQDYINTEIDHLKDYVITKDMEISNSVATLKQDVSSDREHLLKDIVVKIEECKSRIDFKYLSHMNKIDSVYANVENLKKSMNGNGSVGALENIRNLNEKVKDIQEKDIKTLNEKIKEHDACIKKKVSNALFITIVFLLIGGKYVGLTLENIIESILGIKTPPKTSEVQEIKKTDENITKNISYPEIPLEIQKNIEEQLNYINLNKE